MYPCLLPILGTASDACFLGKGLWTGLTTGEWDPLAVGIDAAALAVPFVGIGVMRLGKLVKGLGKTDDAVDLSKTIRPPGKGWSLRVAPEEGVIVHRAWGGTAPETGRWWSRLRMRAGKQADELFDLRSHGNTAEHLTTGMVKPGMPYWERRVGKGVTEVWTHSPKESILSLYRARLPWYAY